MFELPRALRAGLLKPAGFGPPVRLWGACRRPCSWCPGNAWGGGAGAPLPADRKRAAAGHCGHCGPPALTAEAASVQVLGLRGPRRS